jgi:hypothetical protein
MTARRRSDPGANERWDARTNEILADRLEELVGHGVGVCVQLQNDLKHDDERLSRNAGKFIGLAHISTTFKL